MKMNRMPLRDITGNCEGECLDRVREGELLRQKEIDNSSIEYAEYTSENDVPWTLSRNEQPGIWGGHV
jgi:hypothetical protein